MSRRVLFIDRDGTLIIEPPEDFQVDSLEKLAFVPGVFRNLYQIKKNLDFDLVMVTNQDGLGTNSFPEETFWPAHNLMMNTLAGEGVQFDEVVIDKTMPHENAPTRKPGTALLTKYMDAEKYDLQHSFVIGDRLTDVLLAKNLGAKAILYHINMDLSNEIEENGLQEVVALKTNDWDEIYAFLALKERKASVKRTTKETDIEVSIDLDGKGKANIHTGLGFFDHMLEQISKHGQLDLSIQVNGDLQVDEHHTIEDTALALGECFFKALGDKRGTERYGYALPMDDCAAQVLIDFGGRPWLVWDAQFKREKVGDMPTEMFLHFFKSFSDTSKSNLNIKAEGENEHHKIEAIFKAFARAIKMAIKRDAFNFDLPSTKGVL